jgi:hypothetical protein
MMSLIGTKLPIQEACYSARYWRDSVAKVVLQKVSNF